MNPRYSSNDRLLLVHLVTLFSVLMLPSASTAQNSSLLHRNPITQPPLAAPMAPPRTAQPPLAQSPMAQSNVNRPPVGGIPAGNVIPPEFAAPNMMLPNPTSPPSRLASPMMGRVDPAVGLRSVSWTYQPAPPLRAFRVQDIVTIRVDEIARMMAEGEAQKRRNSIFSAVLSDWIKLGKGGIIPDPLEEGDPTIASQSQANSRAEASVESRESMSFNIAARVVDIRPNGNLVLEARKKFRVNDNLWETSLSGICRAQDIAPDNVVLSRDLIDLEIHKQDQGQMRDGYQRGWFQRMFDRVKPF